MGPKLISRREALRSLGHVTLVPLLAHMGPNGLIAWSARHPQVPVEDEGPWRPRFLTEHEDRTVTVLAERIIPQSDTPGAAAVHVNQHIDYVLSRQDEAVRRRFRQGLLWLDARSRQVFGSNFADLNESRRHALLTILASPENRTLSDAMGVEFFHDMKARTITGYYTSEAGMFEELSYEGNNFLSEFPGCSHPEHLQWEPEKQ